MWRKRLPDTSSGLKILEVSKFQCLNKHFPTYKSIHNNSWQYNHPCTQTTCGSETNGIYLMVMVYVWWLPDCHRWGYRQQLTWRVTGERKDVFLHANGVSCIHENSSLQLQLFLESRTWRMAELLNCTDHQLLLKDLMEQIAWPPPFRPIHRPVTNVDEDKQQKQRDHIKSLDCAFLSFPIVYTLSCWLCCPSCTLLRRCTPLLCTEGNVRAC